MLTVAIEGIVGALLLFAWQGMRGRQLVVGVAILAAASCLTHPLAWQANVTWLRTLPFAERAAVIELSVVVVEAVILNRASGWRQPEQRIAWWRALLVSLLMNGASFGYGLLRV